ncbi:hypothetical protein [Actinomadura sp. DC4]|uniref:hypothetical protein n=1 Tax=Actinomadura sp. DC4 TaxID=3055069 RepID=UPI0025AF0D86|nr:hypothetical protein [Actinomadura sp. DC4]MDN3359284.1 hypothetical protein [Actinomadura sp. DC4]
MTFDDLYDGVFTHLRADELRRWDVMFNPVCQVLGDPCVLNTSVVSVQSLQGPRVFSVGQDVWVYRPSGPTTGCDECGAEPEQPCNPVTCCALDTLADAAEATRTRM